MERHVMRHKLSEYIDGSIPSAAKAEIEEHLKTCAACSDALRELERTIEHIKTVEQVEPPAWMTQKTMAKVRAETERRRRGFLFFPVRAKLPIQIFAVLFLTVIAFYIYRNIQPTPNLSEAPTREAPSSVIAKDELGKTDRSSPRSEKAPQTQKYKALDMKLEYEKPAPPIPREQPAAPAQQPPQAANEDVLGKGAAKPQAAAPPPIQERAAPSAGPEPQAGAKSKTISPLEKTAGLSARTDMQGNLERVALESHSNGTPKLIVTYEVVDLRKVKLAEERFNIKGERHGIQREYYESGQVKTEAQYGHGKLKWFKEFSPDGVERSGRSNYDWFWLKE